jgi:hypothetical protein
MSRIVMGCAAVGWVSPGSVVVVDVEVEVDDVEVEVVRPGREVVGFVVEKEEHPAARRQQPAATAATKARRLEKAALLHELMPMYRKLAAPKPRHRPPSEGRHIRDRR